MRKFDNLNLNDALETLIGIPELRDTQKWIMLLNKVNLAYGGANVEENYQIFTPEFIVRDMINAIGIDEVKNVSKNIFEPTSFSSSTVILFISLS